MNAEDRKHLEEEHALSVLFKKEEDRRRRNRRTLFSIILLVLAAGSAIIFYPKTAGGPLCGPVCPQYGLHSWEQKCFGVTLRSEYLDSYTDRCFGIPHGEKTCLGVAEGAESVSEMPCLED